jgi:2,3,4,5-tetrahydropyridine-2-carboxylate N-succinyltransferase
MSNAQLETAIEAAWDARDTITPATTGETREAIEDTLNALDSGSLRVAERGEDGTWHVNQWAKKAVLLGFRLKDMEMQGGSAQGGSWWDKVDSKWAAGARPNGAPQASAPCRTASCANRPISRRASC